MPFGRGGSSFHSIVKSYTLTYRNLFCELTGNTRFWPTCRLLILQVWCLHAVTKVSGYNKCLPVNLLLAFSLEAVTHTYCVLSYLFCLPFLFLVAIIVILNNPNRPQANPIIRTPFPARSNGGNCNNSICSARIDEEELCLERESSWWQTFSIFHLETYTPGNAKQ